MVATSESGDRSRPEARPPQEVIRDKRDGRELAAADIKDFVAGLVDERVSDSQVAAFAMAVFFNGMSRAETVALTEAMRDSGEVLDWSALKITGVDRPVVDKHSTGGIGDNVSLMLAPIVAACGAAVPMISGRGLGHTGGTLDKLEAIPGYRVTPDAEVFRRVVRDVGCAIVGPTGRLAPADGRIYAIRDVTATVESVPMIVASILSKKLASGLDCLVLDVKSGSGAFMPNVDDARALAENLVAVANGAGLKTTALMTRMDEALASAAGNAVEVANAVRFLTGKHCDKALKEVTLALAGEMLFGGGLSSDAVSGSAMALEALTSGAAAERFGRMVAGLGGPADFIERMEIYLPKAPVVRPVLANRDGTIVAVDARAIGMAVVGLGGGRSHPRDIVDPSVGFTELRRVGDRVSRHEPLAMVRAASKDAAEVAAQALRSAYVVGEDAVERSSSAIIERIG